MKRLQVRGMSVTENQTLSFEWDCHGRPTLRREFQRSGRSQRRAFCNASFSRATAIVLAVCGLLPGEARFKQRFHRLADAGGAREAIQAEPRSGVDPQCAVQRRAEVFGRDRVLVDVSPLFVRRTVDHAAAHSGTGEQ